ncbi:MAG: Smr/MutS family protein [Treponema sp.]|jgi:DNA-nicking Smr family endonuclease|nr:Smr/MutS family protein [Treponema sp.]
MDFGKILEQWERETGKPGAFRSGGKKKPEAEGGKKEKPAAGEEGGKPPPGNAALSLTRWLNTNGIYDKDAEEEDRRLSSGEKRRRLLARRPDAEIDLHGLSREEAWASLESFFAYAKGRGFLKVLVIHGKGNHSAGEAVLKRTVREFIERCPFAGESGHRDSRSGGNGATWVLLKEL